VKVPDLIFRDNIVGYRLKIDTLLYIDKQVQDNWTHAIPKELNAGVRISLTFQNIIQ
jgi:hypothetical protein